MYKVGDEVYVKAKIMDLNKRFERPYFARLNACGDNWVSEDKFIPMDKTYESGLKDAWELADKVYEMRNQQRYDVFGTESLAKVMDLSPQEALAKIEAYEKEKSVRVGDVVECNGFKGVVLHIFHSGSLNIVYENGIIETLASVQECKKTGKHIDIEGLLKQIGE